MYKYFAIIFLFCLFETKTLNSQANLVFNSGFEIMTGCPNIDQLSKAAGWYSCLNTPDCFSVCAGVPSNLAGYQQPYSGQAYAGFISYDRLIQNEIIGSDLIMPMNIGTRYYLSLKLSLAEMWVDDTARFIPSNKAGMKFSTVKFSNPFGMPLINNFAHLYTEEIISDTANWVTVQGSFVADSAYKYLMIGNFFFNSNTDTIGRPEIIFPDYSMSYFYVDDIIVSTDSTIITSVQKQKIERRVRVFPNPANDYLSLHSNLNEILTATIYNLFGQLILNAQFDGNNKLDISKLDEGVYYLNIQTNSRSATQKLVVKR